jgi:SSS family solute:Na+ symporter
VELAVVAAFLAVIVAVGAAGARARKAGIEDYFLAGRRLTLPSFVVTLVPTFYGGVLGVGEFTYTSGLSNWTTQALPYYLFAAVYALFLAGKVRLQPGLTIPDHLETAYGRRVAVLGALLVFTLAAPADELLMTGVLIAHLGGFAPAAAMALAALAAGVVLWRGGLRSDVWANRLQILLMYGGFGLVIPAALRAMPPHALRAALPASHLTLSGGLPPLRLLAWWVIAVWTLVDPSFHQRCAAAESPATARLGILLSIACWAVFDLMTTTAGLYARALQGALPDPLLAFPALADHLLQPAARGLFYAGLAATITAALQGRALQAAMSLGKDAVGRLASAPETSHERLARGALPVVLAASLALAWALPSVVGLWYAVGSCVIPGLLLPLLGVYFPAMRVGGSWALAASVAGFGAAAAWFALTQSRGAAPLGLEPMFPGLAASALLWAAGLSRRNLRQA